MVRDHYDSCLLKFLGSTWMLEGAIVPSALAALTGKIGTQFVGHVLGEDIGRFNRWVCEEEHPFICYGTNPSRRVRDSITTNFLLALGRTNCLCRVIRRGWSTLLVSSGLILIRFEG